MKPGESAPVDRVPFDDGSREQEPLTPQERWDAVAGRRPLPNSEETQLAGEVHTAWTAGQGHRVERVGEHWVCVVCGDAALEWPEATCPGPSGVAL